MVIEEGDTDYVTATDVARETDVLPRQAPSGNLLVLASSYLDYLMTWSSTQCFVVSLYHCLSNLPAALLAEEAELLEEVASIGKDAAEEATRIAALEGQNRATGAIQKHRRGAEKAQGSTSGQDTVMEEKIPLQTMGPLPSFGTSAGVPQPSSSKLALVLANPGLGAPVSSVAAGKDFNEEI
jgi:hypothetical protein